jgi:hypothetical protein
MAGDAPFTINPQLSAIAVAYRNGRLIADELLPRTPPVGTKEFRYTLFSKEDAFTVPDTRVGRRGRPNVVEFGGTETPATCLDYALDDEIPQDDIDQARAAGNASLAGPEQRSAEFVADLIALDREVRVASLVTNPANYAAANKIQLAGTTQFSDYVNSNPIGVIKAGLDACVLRPNIVTFGQQAWSGIRSHPAIVKAANKTSGDTGLVSRQAFAEIFELEEVLVGEAWVNSAKKGQAATLARAWGKHMLLSHRNKLADNKRGVTFGMTVTYGQRVAWTRPSPDVGMRGGVVVRVGETVKELITAADCAYLIQDAVA